MHTALQLAVVGAGPVGLALALHAAHTLPQAQITVFDAREAARDISGDPRTLALALGSVQLLQRLQAWPGAAAQPIREVHVSQTPPTLRGAEVHIRAESIGAPMLGAVIAYGALVAALQSAWRAQVSAQPERCRFRLGTPVAAITSQDAAVELDVGIAKRFDLAVIAEGGVFADQARKAVVHDYAQTAWVGTAMLQGGSTGTAFERFTRDGPLALLPLPAAPDGAQRAALVWCVPTHDDPVRTLSDAQRRAVLATLLPTEAGRLIEVSSLKSFALGLNAERTLVQGRTVRIGNAAQTLHPVAGQGLNLGLRDAYELVARLRWADDVDAALRRMEWSRAADRWSIIATTDFLARSFTWQAPGLGTLRAAGLAALQATPMIKGWLAQRMMFGSR